MKNKKYFIIFILLLAISIMSFGYAMLTTKIYIVGTANIEGIWDIRITNVKILSTSNNLKTSLPTYNNTYINFNTELTKPGDEIKYQVTIANQGNIKAQLNNVLFKSEVNDEECPIIFETSEIAKYLDVGEETTFIITIKYDDKIIDNPQITTNKLTGFIEYVQS